MKTDPRKAGSTARRKLLKKMGAGSGVLATASAVPGEWTKPIVKGILLPAHASTTDDTGALPGEPTTTCNPEYGFVRVDESQASYYCSGGYYLLRCYIAPPDNANVQVEVSGTGVCSAVEGTHDTSSDNFSSFDGSYKWAIFEDCAEPESFTAVFSIADSCEEPLVVQGEKNGCNQPE